MSSTGLMPGPAPSDDRPRARAIKRWQIGGVTITRIVERGGRSMPIGFMFADATAALVRENAWLVPHFATEDGRIYTVVQAFVVESRGRRIIVDTCVGNNKPRTTAMFNMLQTTFLEDLAAAGFSAESIDTVLCTHLHVDHVGWNTRWLDCRWQPTFAHARYLFGKVEWEHWKSEGTHSSDGDVLGDSVTPVIEAGLVDLVAMDHVLTDEVRLIPTPGHTPGHVSVKIESGGAEAVITGDLMHHPIQCSSPDLASNFDADPEAARSTRRAFLAEHAGRPIPVFGTHFADPTAGWIEGDGEAWRFAVVPEAATAPLDVRLSSDGLRWES